MADADLKQSTEITVPSDTTPMLNKTSKSMNFASRGTSRGRMRNRGRGNPPGNYTSRFNASTTTESVDEKASASQTTKPKSKASGAFVSTFDSHERVDPRKFDSSIVNGLSLSAIPTGKHIHSEAASFDVIVNACHRKNVSKSAGFARRITVSVYAWYHSILLWYRILSLKRRNGLEIPPDAIQFCESMETSSFVFDEPIVKPTEGLGDTIGPGERNLLFTIPDINFVAAGGVNGWFGRVDHQTHYLYGAYPCTATYAYRIIQELTMNEDMDNTWDLPDPITPLEPNHGHPTQNFLGYRPLVRPRPDARAFING